jgi:hypothetical protein
MAARLLEYPPVYCSACWCADPEKRHVDYAADNDQGYGPEGSTVTYDNLQICETCMKAGGQLVGMVDSADRDRDIADKEVKIDQLERELRQARTFTDNLESAFENRPEHGPIRIDHRRKPRKQFEVA